MQGLEVIATIFIICYLCIGFAGALSTIITELDKINENRRQITPEEILGKVKDMIQNAIVIIVFWPLYIMALIVWLW